MDHTDASNEIIHKTLMESDHVSEEIEQLKL